MPRKPKLPTYEIHIEALSTGKIVHKQEYCDITGEPLPLSVDISPSKPLVGADKIMAERQRMVEQAKRKLWTMLKPDKVPMLGPKEPEPTHAKVRLGDYIARIPLPRKKSWRRM